MDLYLTVLIGTNKNESCRISIADELWSGYLIAHVVGGESTFFAYCLWVDVDYSWAVQVSEIRICDSCNP